ncbi:ATP-dependent protease La [Meira miltonrushii]|uniref:Lon protease homolog, mitochondrial n=1 Tax=Meira miltonrushii TaxID=1280837 RepID=A0A316VD54_9BASI|nr:ATP-dependent protease La [Meira miltonrushii]PWN35492.1 ATP-dependent protease La [Meira miltonrushii]
MIPAQRFANAARGRNGALFRSTSALASNSSNASCSSILQNRKVSLHTKSSLLGGKYAGGKAQQLQDFPSQSPFVRARRRELSSFAPLQMPRSKGKVSLNGEGEEEEFDGRDEGREEAEVDAVREDDARVKASESDGKGSSAPPSGSSGSASGAGSASQSGGNSGSGASSGSSSDGGSNSNSTSVSKPSVPVNYPQVLALPITRRPLFPGFYKAVVIKNPAVCAAIRESLKRGQPYIGAFLLKDEEDDADVITDLSKVHRVGVFAQITSIFSQQSASKGSKDGKGGNTTGNPNANEDEEGLTAVLYPHRRIQIDELLPPDGKRVQSEKADGQITTTDSSAKVHDIQQEARDTGVVPEKNDAESTQQSPASHGMPYQTSFLQDYAVSLVNVTNLESEEYKKDDGLVKAVKAELIAVFKDIALLNPLFRDQIANFSISQGAGNVFEEPDKLADFAAAVSSGEVGELQSVLETLNVGERLQKALLVLKKELMNAQLQNKISKDVEQKIQKRQREYYLTEQLRGIKKELGIETDGKDKMVEKFKEKAATLKMPEQVRKVFDEELNKLQTLEPAASEFNVTRGYLEWLTNIPWGVHSPENYSIANAVNVLDQDHYGLKDVKDRILEFLAVGKLKGTVQGKIICLVGPPGVGKTSIGKSIARAVQRQFFRFSVGGLSDVAEIKGHRRTYVGAMPGKAIQALKKVGTENPLVLIDEVDKIGRGHNGDPSSALLEMLDPEQNGSFLDHYMDVPVDLSRVLFVCTANTLDTIPQPLLDRMEVIEVSSYTAEEKKHIARGYLAPQAKEASGLQDANVTLPDETIEFLVRSYARESGVRQLRKLLEKVYRKIAFNIVREYGEDVFPEPKNAEAKPEATVQDGGASISPNSENPKPTQDEYTPTAAVGSAESNAQSVTPPPPHSAVPAEENKESSEQSAGEDGNPKTTTEERKPMAVPPTVAVNITIDSLRDYIGPAVYHKDRLYERIGMPAGVATGLGYLGNGSGSLMPIETTTMPGKGNLQLTGKLGEVIKESASIALSWLKSQAFELGITDDNKSNLLESRDVHLHMPEGAIGKEGPSAGVAFVTSLVSLLTGRTLSTELAMTGEVSLRGMVLPVGGLKEKLLAAHRAGIKKVILPGQNRPNVEADVPKPVLDDLEVHYVNNVWSALEVAFGEGPWTQKAREMESLEGKDDGQAKDVGDGTGQDNIKA